MGELILNRWQLGERIRNPSGVGRVFAATSESVITITIIKFVEELLGIAYVARIFIAAPAEGEMCKNLLLILEPRASC